MHFNDIGNSSSASSYPSNSRNPDRTLSSPDLRIWGTLAMRLGVFLYSHMSADFRYVKSWSTVAFDTFLACVFTRRQAVSVSTHDFRLLTIVWVGSSTKVIATTPQFVNYGG